MTEKTHGYVNNEYLVAAAELFAKVKTRSYELMGDLHNKTLLDIGCGSGVDTVAMSSRVGPNGKVHGVDFDAEMINVANKQAISANLTELIEHQCADAYNLPFNPNTFDAVRSERLFMHLKQPEIALSEAVRVTKPSGKVVILDTDWGSLSANTGSDNIENRIKQFRVDQFIPNGYSGRRLYSLLTTANLDDIIVENITLHTTNLNLWRFLTLSDSVAALAIEHNVISKEEMLNWNQSMNQTSDNQAFFGSVNIVLTCGTVGLDS